MAFIEGISKYNTILALEYSELSYVFAPPSVFNSLCEDLIGIAASPQLSKFQTCSGAALVLAILSITV